jgi:exopolysaccharide production protein ExoQ
MSPSLATLAFFLGILGLFFLARDRKTKTSAAVWIPVCWVLIAGSRMVSQWLQMAPPSSADQFLEGSPLDRNILTALWAAGGIVLLTRGKAVKRVLQANGPVVLFLIYCGVSALWSDYPDVSIKRWFKFLGDVVMVLVVLTDADPTAAIKRFLKRVGFILLPASVLLIRYYPDLGRAYDRWTGRAFFTGVTTDKNMLGMGCLVFGLGCAWQFIQEYRGRRGFRVIGPLIAHGTVLVMTIWLLFKANSMTSLSCFLLAASVMALATIRILTSRRALLHVLVFTVIAVAFSVLFLNVGGGLMSSMGRDPTLTGRTDVWKTVLGMEDNPVLGAGFDSFWLGTRLTKIWSIYWWRPNESHNGYLEVYLNLGWLGIALMVAIMATAYRNAIAAFRRDPAGGSLRLAYFVALVTYNFTEAAVKTFHPLWITFLLSTMAIPQTRAAITPAAEPLVTRTLMEGPEIVRHGFPST